jgi:hypothetical protein
MKLVFIHAHPYIGISGRGGHRDNIGEAKELGKLLAQKI